MSTTLLYRAFGIRGYEYRRTTFFGGQVCFDLEQSRERYRGSNCGSAAVRAQGSKDRFLQTIPIGLKPTFVCVKVPRVGKPELKNLKEIAIDEVAIGKGHRYFMLVLDLRSGAAVGDGDGDAALADFWPRLRAERARIRAVATDMGKAYIRAVREHLPRAVHVFDPFHVIKLFNDKLSAFRRQLDHQAQSEQERRIIKGTRWLLLKNPGPLEGDNNKIQTMKRQAYGFRDPEFFKLKILAIHQTKYALLGGASYY